MKCRSYNIMVFGCQMGHTFEKLLLDCFKLSTYANGDKVFMRMIVDIKHLHAPHNGMDKALIKQQLYECTNHRFLGNEAVK